MQKGILPMCDDCVDASSDCVTQAAVLFQILTQHIKKKEPVSQQLPNQYVKVHTTCLTCLTWFSSGHSGLCFQSFIEIQLRIFSPAPRCVSPPHSNLWLALRPPSSRESDSPTNTVSLTIIKRADMSACTVG